MRGFSDQGIEGAKIVGVIFVPDFRTSPYDLYRFCNGGNKHTLIPECIWYDDGDDDRDSSGQTLDCGRYAIYGVQFLFRF